MKQNNHMLKNPKYYPDSIDWTGKAYMPVSMNNKLLKEKETLLQILGWIFNKTNRLEAIIGDFLHRHNVLLTGINEEEAIRICNELGKVSEELLQSVMQYFPNKRLCIRHVGEFYSRDIFKKKLDYFNKVYNNNENFCNEIDFLVHQFLQRQGHIEGTKIQIMACKNYLLEEMVIFEMLQEDGFAINIYPGKQLRVLKKIVLGNLNGISKKLEKISLIEMRFKPQYISSWIKQSKE